MKLKPYTKYKDSGVEWIEKIPKTWENFKLKHIIHDFISGGTPSSDNEKFWSLDKGIPWVNIGDMTNNEFVKNTSKKITIDGLADKKLNILKKGTLIYSIFASLGKVSVLEIDATTNQAILGLITTKKINRTYLKYYLKSLEKPIIALSNANTQKNINSTIVKNIKISIPRNINQQSLIACFLDEKISGIDKIINKVEFLVGLLEEYKKSLVWHVVTGKVDVRRDYSLNQIHQKKNSKQTSLII